MNTTKVVGAALILFCSASVAAAQDRSRQACQPASAPARISGTVLSVDESKGRVKVQDAAGAIHEFEASRDTLKDLKTGDRLEASLRSLPKC